LLIRFCRGREELNIDVTSKYAPDRWHDIWVVLGLLGQEDAAQFGPVPDLWRASGLLEPHFDRLLKEFGGAGRQALELQLAESDARNELARREAEWKIRDRIRSNY
jgi:hypothetical protein